MDRGKQSWVGFPGRTESTRSPTGIRSRSFPGRSSEASRNGSTLSAKWSYHCKSRLSAQPSAIC